MAGLVGYASSDEDDEVETPQPLQVSVFYMIHVYVSRLMRH